MHVNNALKVSNDTMEVFEELLTKLEELLKNEAFQFQRVMKAIIMSIRGILIYENSSWDTAKRYQGVMMLLESLFDYVPLDYSLCRRDVIAKFLNTAEQFDPKVRKMVAKKYGLKRVNKNWGMWYYDKD